MRNIKFIAVFAAFGFILSFAFGIFSHTSFLSVMLKALLFGIIFAALGFGISFVTGKFLMDESGSEISSDLPNSTVNKSDSNSKGNYVDITIRDEELPQSVSGNRFNVGENHQLLNETDINNTYQYQSIKTVPEVAPDENVSFKPVREVEDISNVSSKESVKPENLNGASVQESNSVSVRPENNGDFNSDKDIDTLPDMTGFSINSESNESSSVNTDDDNETEFVTSSTRSVRSDGEVPEIKDASLYAKAISSILSGEEE